MTHPILFYDPCSPKGYDHKSLQNESLGGTEGTVIRIAEKLAEKHTVVVAERMKTTFTTSKNVQYIPFSPFLLNMSWHAVIVLRNLDTVLQVRDALPNTPVWLWAHDLVDTRFLPYIYNLKKKNIGIIAVSKFLKKQLGDLRLMDPLIPELPLIKIIYNPIDDNLNPDSTPVNKDKLLFPSSSYKGLDNTIRVFKMLREKHPDFELVVTNPSYHKTKMALSDGVHYLGSQTHARNIQEMRSSLAVFQMNHEVPETFGLVFAEANAVGTPCLAHPFGAAPEVLTNPDQLVNTYDREAVIQKTLDWRFKERPKVDIPDKFRLSTVIQEWENLLQI